MSSARILERRGAISTKRLPFLGANVSLILLLLAPFGCRQGSNTLTGDVVPKVAEFNTANEAVPARRLIAKPDKPPETRDTRTLPWRGSKMISITEVTPASGTTLPCFGAQITVRVHLELTSLSQRLAIQPRYPNDAPIGGFGYPTLFPTTLVGDYAIIVTYKGNCDFPVPVGKIVAMVMTPSRDVVATTEKEWSGTLSPP